jgi:hypothetical protein
MRSTCLLTELLQIAFRGLCSFALVASSVVLSANEPFLNKPSNEWSEAEALQVLNDSPWAHTITTTTQDTQCNYEHPAFPGLFREEMAQIADSRSHQFAAEPVKPDGAEYVVRLVSVKPMQAAVERLVTLDEKWKPYAHGIELEPNSKPTNVTESWYNPADEITVVVALKHAGPGGSSYRDYAFEDEKTGLEFTAHHYFACAGIRTANGQVHAVTNRFAEGNDNRVPAIVVSFPRAGEGKPLITHRDEKVEFRLVVNQRVFETTFIVNLGELFDGTETMMRVPARVDESTPQTDP